MKVVGKYYLEHEAAAVLDMNLEVFSYFNRRNLLCYILVDGIKVFTMKELDRFYREVILGGN